MEPHRPTGGISHLATLPLSFRPVNQPEPAEDESATGGEPSRGPHRGSSRGTWVGEVGGLGGGQKPQQKPGSRRDRIKLGRMRNDTCFLRPRRRIVTLATCDYPPDRALPGGPEIGGMSTHFWLRFSKLKRRRIAVHDISHQFV